MMKISSKSALYLLGLCYYWDAYDRKDGVRCAVCAVVQHVLAQGLPYSWNHRSPYRNPYIKNKKDTCSDIFSRFVGAWGLDLSAGCLELSDEWLELSFGCLGLLGA